MISELENFLDEVDTPKDQHNKRKFLKQLVENGEALPGKTPWTLDRLDKASDKVIDKLYSKAKDPTVQAPQSSKDLMSRIAGVDDVNSMMKDINSNFLIKNQATEMMGKLTPTISLSANTPMEVLGSHMYDKCGVYLAPVSLFCTVFNHLDWQNFARIAEQRATQEPCPPSDELPPEQLE